MPYLPLPDGTYMEVPKGLSDDEAFELARKKYPEAFPEFEERMAKTGFIPAVKSGFKSGLGSAARGVGEITGAESLVEYGKGLEESAAEGFQPITKEEVAARQRQGILPGAGALLSEYVTEPVGGAVGSIAGRYGAPIAGGVAAGALAPGAAIAGVPIAGALGFAAANLPIHIGENITRQKEQGKPVDMEAATVYGVAQTAVDSLGGAVVTGAMKGLALKTATQEAKVLLPKIKTGEITAEAAAAQVGGKLRNYLIGTAEIGGAGTGMAIGTEALRRASAQQDLTNQEAIDTYTQIAKDMGLLAPFMGFLRVGETKRAKNLIDTAAKQGEAQRTEIAREQQAGVMKDYYASPEGQAEIQRTQAEFVQRITDLEAVRKQKDLSKEDKRAVGEQIKELKQQQEEFNKRVGAAAPEVPGAYKTLEQRIEELKTKREQEAAEAQAKLDQQQAAEAERLQQARELRLGEEIPPSKFVELPGAKSTLTVAEKEAQARELEDTRTMLANSIPRMENMLDRIQSQIDEAVEKGDTKAYRDLIETRTQVSEALDAAQKQRETLPKLPEEERAALEKEVSTLKKQAAKYTGPAFDQEKLDKIIGKLEKAQKRLDELPVKEQEDLFAPKQQALAFEPTKEDLAYEARRAELEETFNTQMPQKVADDLIESINNQPKSAENLELNALRIERINRAINEAKAANDPDTVSVLNERLAEAKSSVESLGGSWSELTRRAEGRFDKALMDQQKAIDELRDAVEDLVKSRYLGRGQKETAFAETTKKGLVAKAEQAAGDYIEAAVRDVDARRAAAKQKPMSSDEALKLAYDLKDALENVIKNKNLSVLLRPEYMQQRLRLGQETLRQKMPDEERLVLNRIAAQYSKMQKENVLQEGISQLEKQLAGIKQKYAKGESALRVEKQFFTAMERDPVQMLRTEKAKSNPDLNKIRFLEKQIAEAEEPVTGVSKVEKTGEYEVTDEKGVVRKVPTYEVKEQAALTPREKELAKLYPEYVKPDEGGVDLAQRELFGERDLAPVATVRATPANFMRFVNTQKQKLQLAKKLAQQAVEKARVENDKYSKIVQELEKVKLELETVPLENAPALYTTVKEATKVFETARKNLEEFTSKQEENAKALAAGLKSPYDLGRGSYQLEQKQRLTKAFQEAKKNLEDAQRDQERLPAARIKKFVEDSRAKRNAYIKRYVQLQVKKDNLLEKLGVTSEKRPLTEAQIAALLEQDNKKALIAKLSSDLETSYAQTKAALESRASAMRELFSKPLEQSLEKESVALTKKEIKFYEDRIKWLKENTKGKSAKAKFVFEKEIPAYEKRLTELNKILDDEQSYIDSIRGREESIVLSDIVRARENNDAFVKRTRKRLKKLLDESEAKGEVDQAFSQATLGRFDETSAKAAADLEKKIAEKRVAEQEALEKGAAAVSARQEVKPVQVKEEVAAKGVPEELGVTTERTVEIGTKSRKLAAVRKLIRTKEEQLAKAKEGTPEYAKLERQLGILKEARDRERQPLMQKEVTKKVGLAKTAAEKRQEVIEKSREGAAEMAGIRKRLGKAPSEKQDTVADIKAYIKALETRITANENALKTKALVGPLKQKFESLADKKETLNDVLKYLNDELAQEKTRLAEVQERSKAERALVRLGGEPPRKERKKALKTGVAEFEEGVKAEREGEFESLFEGELEYKPEVNFTRDDFDNAFRLGKKGEGKVNVAETRKLAEETKAKLPDGINFIYADSIETLPDYVKKQIDPEDLRTLKGVVLEDGTVVAVGNTHANRLDFEMTLAHELAGHYGFDRLLGRKGLYDLAKRIQAKPGGIIRMAREMGVLNDVVRAVKDAKERGGLTPEGEMVTALREMVAYVEQNRLTDSFIKRSIRFIKEMVGAFRNWLRNTGLTKLEKVSDADLLYLLKESRDAIGGKGAVLPSGPIGLEKAFRKSKFTDPNDPLASAAKLIVGKERGIVSTLKGNLAAFNTQFVDRLAPIKEIWRRMGETTQGSQMIYNLLAHGQRTNITSETVVNGPRIFYKNPETGEVTIRAGGGPGMKDVLTELLKSKKGNVQALNEGFTTYAIAKRADDVGFNKLVMDGVIDGKEVTPQMLAAAKKSGDADPHFVKAFEIYQKYNNGLIDNLVESGYLSAQKGKELKAKNYVPYYRIRNGNAELMVGMESPIRIGSLKDQPYLKELVGGETKVRDFFKSAVENTAMITEMALRNNATSSVANTLKGLGIAEIHKGNGPASPNVIRFKSAGKDYHAVIDTSKNAEFNDISPELLVKGLEGIPTQLPGIVRIMGVPANWLRKGVTRNPFYAYKQLIRDPISAYLTTGGNFAPILSSLKEIGKAARGVSDTSKAMQEAGITGGEVYTGRAEDLNQIVTRLKGGSANLTGAMAFMDRVASQADASTRSVLYESFRKQGLTDMEAQIATMESMNFNTRGASPSMHWVNTMVPFFNSAVQGYNVLYKAFTGKMPYAKKLEIQNKLIKRGSMIAGMSILYAIASQDNEAYQNATPEQKYMNWFIPGFGAEGKESFRMPIPFEAGYIFKALPEAIVNMAYKDDAAKEGLDAIKVVLNATNPLGIPTAIKAPLEAYGFNKSIYTGRDIESIRLQQYEPGQRYYDTTNEGPKMLGEMLNISPAKLDYLFKNYFGGLYTTISALVNPLLIDSRTVKPDGSLADTPAFGTLFQPEDGGGIVRSAYDALESYAQKSGTLERLQETGREKEAEQYYKKYEKEIGLGQAAGTMKSQLDSISAEIRRIKESVLQPGQNREQFAKEKRDQIKELQANRTKLAKDYLKTIAETKRQSSPGQ